jgi:hypothetical protein
LSFKIILIQKSQISIFRKGLNLFEFEIVFDLDLNLDFKFKSAAKIFQKHFHFLLAAQNRFRPMFPSSPSATSGFFSFSSLASPLGHAAYTAHFGPAHPVFIPYLRSCPTLHRRLRQSPCAAALLLYRLTFRVAL